MIARYSVYEDANEIPMDRLIASGTFCFVEPYGDGWKDSLNVKDPTYADALLATQRYIDDTGDTHHRFLEGVDIDEKKRTIRLILGS